MTKTAETHPIHAQGLSKRFGSIQAVSHIDLNVAAGSALGLLGPNGAGKSTTLSMLIGITPPDTGQALIFGHPAGSPQARALLGVTPQSTGFPGQLTPREIIAYTAARYGTRPNTCDLVERFGLEQLIDRRVAGFSGGQMRRVALALAFVGAPRLVFLDEPTTGLDAEAQDAFHAMARAYVAQGGTLVLTSHQWDDIEAVCGAIALIDRGESVLSGKLEDIRARTAVHRLSFALPAGNTPPEWMQASHDGHLWHAETAQSDNVLRRMIDQNVPFHSLTIEPLKLRELINRLRQEEIAA